MLLPSGRCNDHCRVVTGSFYYWMGRWYCLESIVLFYFKFWDVVKQKSGGSRNIKRPPPPYLTTTTPLVTKISLENFGIVGREDQNLMKTIKEALYIRANNPPLNKNIGKYHLPHILGWGFCLTSQNLK